MTAETQPLSPAAQAILDYWFGAPDAPEYGQFRAFWFEKSAAVDAEMAARFAESHVEAAAGGLDAWAATPRGALALVLLLDQVPRNIFRDTPAAFATDARALDVAKEAIREGLDTALIPVERLFLYMPFQHAEDLVEQERSLALYDRLGLDNATEFAARHHEIIARFGRFPHRNAILDRDTTPDEAEFLTQPNSSF